MDEDGAEVSDHLSEMEDDSESFVKSEDAMADHTASDGACAEKKKYDPKDPLRPRRKKARRACFACQRAHLTCGDERPCKRCIKRGLADACQDGIRKKAKYLHDAPPEALRPVLGPGYNPKRPDADYEINRSHPDNALSATGSFVTRNDGGPYGYPAVTQPPVTMHNNNNNNNNIGFNPQAPGPSSSYPTAHPSQNAMVNMMPEGSVNYNTMFDPSNPALYNFDLEGLNFGSQYAGWEFGILNQMGLGAETPTRENSITQTPTTDGNYAPLFGPHTYDASMLAGDYGGLDPSSGIYSQGNLQHGLPHAFAIPAGPTSLTSPSTDNNTASPQPGAAMEKSPSAGGFGGMSDVPVAPAPTPAPAPAPRPRAKPDKFMQSILGKRQRDSASIYASVKEPYPYVAGFHNMISVLRNRLPRNKLLTIARSLGEIRPSFIACTKDLTREDLVFMEKCFQRTLVEFDDFLQHSCAPTIVCRRSGEVAAVNKEFTALTGWPKAVLLGKQPNLNILSRPARSRGAEDGDNVGRSGGGPAGPLLDGGRPHPVFLGELLDDDSVVEFYRDFAQLAFEDSRGKVERSGRLMKYRPSDDPDLKDAAGRNPQRAGILSNRVTKIDSEHGIARIEKDGKVDCAYCWTIKRDMFDIPMMIIINFLPRFYPNQEPHQLAV